MNAPVKLNRRVKRQLDQIAEQFTYADGLIERHRDAINKLEEAKEKLRAISIVTSIIARSDESHEQESVTLRRQLELVTLEIRDCNWRQYG